jgi:hypothetical protein
MNCYDEEFYYEPTEFEQKIDELKISLASSIKEDFFAELERLKKENKELQEVKANFDEIKRDYENKKRDLDRERNDLQSRLRRERLVDLLKDHQLILYKAYSKRVLPQKCDKCDNNRRIQYTSPLGRKTYEDCLCKEGKLVYFPYEYVRYEFRLNRDKNGVTAWYRQYSDNEDGFVSDSSIHADYIYSPNISFEELKQYNTFFKTKEECQEYCDWLNSNK